MARNSPIRQLHQQAEASLLIYGPPDTEHGAVELVESYGELELEYSAVRKSCGLFDQPHRAVIEVTGNDRPDFLNRMLTQELKDLSPFHVRRSFWLNKKGRIDADLRVIDLPNRTLLECDIHAAARLVQTLSAFIVTEDVTIVDASEKYHRLALHGPTGVDLLRSLAQHAAGADASGPSFDELLPDRACVVYLGLAETVVYREDSTGSPGLELIVPASQALRVFGLLIENGQNNPDPGRSGSLSLSGSGDEPASASGTLGSRIRLRPIGWHAYNIARIEAGTPLYNIDFGLESLPAETGIMKDRVSFKKGCYLGQEIVARMDARGHPKQTLVGLKFEVSRDEATGFPRQPVSGSPVTAPDPVSGQPTTVGMITSSTLAPLLSSTPIAFAQVRWGHHTPGAVLTTFAEGVEIKGAVQGELTFLKQKPGVSAT